MFVAVILVIAFLLGALIIGVIVGNQNPPTHIDVSNNMDGKCDANCAQLQQRRSETCTQRRQVAGLVAEVDSLPGANNIDTQPARQPAALIGPPEAVPHGAPGLGI